MLTIDVNDAAVVRQKEILDRLLTTNPKTQAALQKLIRQVVLEARAQVVSSIHFKNGDPHHSRRAVRTTVYKKILGANLNILNSRRAHGSQSYQQQRTLREGQRGGNRVKPTLRTLQLRSYAPEDRGFILRFVNDGISSPRQAGSRGGHLSGNRGVITAQRFFRMYGERALSMAAERLDQLIDNELENIVNKKK